MKVTGAHRLVLPQRLARPGLRLGVGAGCAGSRLQRRGCGGVVKGVAAQRALGAATATETIERALDMVVFQRELIRGTRAMLGITIESPDTAQ